MKPFLFGVVSIALSAPAWSQSRVELVAVMTGTGKSKAVWKTRDSSGQYQAELQVEAERLRPNTTYTIVIGTGQFRANVRTDSLGSFRLVRRYTTANRPNIQVGTPSVLLLNVYRVSKGTFVTK
jgi:hypothetical protein